MSSTLRRGHRWWLLKAAFVLATCFAAGLVTSGVVAGAGPLAALSSVSEGDPTTETTETTGATATESTETTATESTDTTATEPQPTQNDAVPVVEPSIAADKEDYVPEEFVALLGAGWQPNESVHIFVNDDESQSWSHHADVTADELGAFMHDFQLPNWFVASYSVTATGSSGVMKRTTFADSVAVGASSTNDSGGGGAGSQRIAISAPAVSAGDVLVAQIVITDAISDTFICSPAGWTSILKNANAPSNSVLEETFWFRASTASGAVTHTWEFRTNSCSGSLISQGTKGASGGVVRFTGVIGSGDPVDVSAGSSGTSSGPFTAPNVVTTVANTHIVRYFGAFKNINITHASTPRIYEEDSSATKERTAAAFDSGTHATAGGAGPGSFTATFSSSAEFVSQTIALKPVVAAVSAAPTVNSPICAGATSVSGTSSEADGTSIEVFKNNVSVGTTTVTGGAWTKSSLAALVAGDQIKARATATGESVSADSNTVTVTSCNAPPTAVDDTYATNEDTNLVLDADAAGPNASPVDNDTDSNGDSLTVTAVSNAAGGTVGLASGTITFTPTGNLCGAGVGGFDYTVSDGNGGTDVGRVTVNITCVDDPPTAVDDAATVAEDSGATAVTVLANDTDPDGGPKTIASASDPANGTVVITGGGSGLTYAPDANYCNSPPGTTLDTFTYSLSPGGDTATVSMTVTCVDDAPTAVDDAKTVLEDSGATTVTVLANDTDPDGGPKTIASASDPAHGTVVVAGDNLSLTYAPDANYCNDGTTTDTFTYTLNGGSQATVRMTVTCVDDPPVVAFTGGATARTEGQSDTYTFSITDPDSSSFTYGSGYPTCGSGGTLTGTPTLGSTGGSFQCSFADGPASPVLAVKVRDASSASDEATRQVTVTNVNPTVAKPTFDPTLIGCQNSTTLKGISFGDPGVNDNLWTVDIDWGDGSQHTTYATATQGAQPNQTHTYATAGTFTATVKVTDKDGGDGTNSTTANSLTVFRYTIDFLPPFDDSTPSGLIVNKMKNGRVVPVKAKITDLCSGSDVTGPGTPVRIELTKTAGSGTGDPIEEYADAGQSSAGTDEFRWADGYWIYNLDSKALGLVVNNLYRVDVYVNGVKATVSNWAVLQPVK